MIVRALVGTLAFGVAAVVALAACAASGSAGTPGSSEPDASAAGVPVRLTIGTTVLTAHLHDNPTARDLLGQLPLTLTFRDLNGVEKIAQLPRPLTTDGVPAGADPEIRDIGYYAPSNDLVLYYGDVGHWNGIVRIGRYDASIEAVQGLADGATVTIERAN